MNFSEFTNKYRNTLNPAGGPWTQNQMMADSGLSEAVVKEWTEFWYAVQRISVTKVNKIPSNEEIISIHDSPVETVTPPPPPPPPKPVPIPPTQRARSPYNPTGFVVAGQLTADQMKDLIKQSLEEYFDEHKS